MNATAYREGWAMCSGWKDSEYWGKKSSQAPTLMSPSCGSGFLNSDTCLLLQVSVLYHLCPFSSKQSSILYYVFIPGSYTQWMLNRWMYGNAPINKEHNFNGDILDAIRGQCRYTERYPWAWNISSFIIKRFNFIMLWKHCADK